MNAKQFREWREQFKLTQDKVAQMFRVSRTTVQNWESGATPISQAVEMCCDVWGPRLNQENPNLGPVTLIYSDGPMFVDPYGPRHAPALLRQEPYQSNAAALARVKKLWGHNNFHNPFIIEQSGKPLWNVIELQRVIENLDLEAPTIPNMIRLIARDARAARIIVRNTEAERYTVQNGPGLLVGDHANEHMRLINEAAAKLDNLANEAVESFDGISVRYEEISKELRDLGLWHSDSLVTAIAQAFNAARLH